MRLLRREAGSQKRKAKPNQGIYIFMIILGMVLTAELIGRRFCQSPIPSLYTFTTIDGIFTSKVFLSPYLFGASHRTWL